MSTPNLRRPHPGTGHQHLCIHPCFSGPHFQLHSQTNPFQLSRITPLSAWRSPAASHWALGATLLWPRARPFPLPSAHPHLFPTFLSSCCPAASSPGLCCPGEFALAPHPPGNPPQISRVTPLSLSLFKSHFSVYLLHCNRSYSQEFWSFSLYFFLSFFPYFPPHH